MKMPINRLIFIVLLLVAVLLNNSCINKGKAVTDKAQMPVDTIYINHFKHIAYNDSMIVNLPVKDSNNIEGKINNFYTYTYRYAGDTDLADGTFDKYGFDILNTTSSHLSSFKDILGVWIIEKSNDGTKLSVPVKTKAIDEEGSADIFLVEKDSRTRIDSTVDNYTNAPFLVIRGEEYLVYLHSDKVILYSIKEKRNAVIAVLKIKTGFQCRNNKIHVTMLDNNILSISLTVKEWNKDSFYLTSFNLPVKSMPE